MKKIAFLLVLMLLCNVLFVGCNTTEDEGQPSEPIDYSAYPFTDVSWTRDGGHDEETIRFGADGSFTYSCACGNPVNDADLCDSYTYDDNTKTITLDCIETTDEMITVIKIVKCEANELQLDFDGDVRVFTK